MLDTASSTKGVLGENCGRSLFTLQLCSWVQFCVLTGTDSWSRYSRSK